MKICRFEPDRVGVVRGGEVIDVTDVVETLPLHRWPLPLGDQFIAQLDAMRPAMERLVASADRYPVGDVALLSPVANPGKIIGAPTNYRAHIAEALGDPTLAAGHQIRDLRAAGMFLKATSALAGSSQGIEQRFPHRRNDPEVELAVVIGKSGNRISREHALNYVAGYTVAIDMTVRGPEFQSFRKSLDSYATLGPWLVTKDEISNPADLGLRLWVNDDLRQEGNTRDMIAGVPELIEYATSFYSVQPGDVIITGTPAGVAPVKPGDRIRVWIERIGEMEVTVRASKP